MSIRIRQSKSGIKISAKGKDAQRLFSMMTAGMEPSTNPHVKEVDTGDGTAGYGNCTICSEPLLHDGSCKNKGRIVEKLGSLTHG